jgi:hypothetical protein
MRRWLVPLIHQEPRSLTIASVPWLRATRGTEQPPKESDGRAPLAGISGENSPYYTYQPTKMKTDRVLSNILQLSTHACRIGGTAAKQEGVAWTESLRSYRELEQKAPSTTRTMPQMVAANLVQYCPRGGATETTSVHYRPWPRATLANLSGRPAHPDWQYFGPSDGSRFLFSQANRFRSRRTVSVV